MKQRFLNWDTDGKSFVDTPGPYEMPFSGEEGLCGTNQSPTKAVEKQGQAPRFQTGRTMQLTLASVGVKLLNVTLIPA